MTVFDEESFEERYRAMARRLEGPDVRHDFLADLRSDLADF